VGRIASIAAAGLLALALTACGERSEPTGPASKLYPVTVASGDGGRPLVLRTPAKRIAVVAPSVQQILVDLGAGRQIAGTPIARNGSLRVTELRSLHPDLIVGSSSTDDQLLAQAARAAPKALVYQAPDDSIRGVERTITALGLLAGAPGDASRLIRDIEEKRALVAKRLVGTVPVSVFVDKGLFTTVTNQSLAGDMLREVHARNVAGDSAQVGPIDPDQLARLDPTWYLATSDSGTTLAKLRRNPRTRKLRAVRLGHFAVVDASLLAPGPTIGNGLIVLAHRLHPDAFR
jgi:ABC-type Fe3+-hydroxamate transport system substrate-binding protein